MSADPRVREALEVLGGTYGPLGVALVFALAAAGVDDKQVLRDQLQAVLGAEGQPQQPARPPDVAAGPPVPPVPPVPSVGRVVHYVSYGTPAGEFPSVCRAATIAEVGAWVPEVRRAPFVAEDNTRLREVVEQWHGDACALVVLNPAGVFHTTVKHHEQVDGRHLPGTWHWPERV
ncbi:hypothetical protein F5972_08635 [Microbispora cellulosiformans]|uniref:Uncharacterized protein n=1 Tax=Microbispora cellulosiformans TaxID=2614688 RepID=A0A5J5K5Y7_9ACTN|nr:hypothetical protein [Microbispora cellulosiformans]KAA9379707.1 hypothetical protein F5972_08635 [Microbispora cellulosiformans]